MYFTQHPQKVPGSLILTWVKLLRLMFALLTHLQLHRRWLNLVRSINWTYGCKASKRVTDLYRMSLSGLSPVLIRTAYKFLHNSSFTNSSLYWWYMLHMALSLLMDPPLSPLLQGVSASWDIHLVVHHWVCSIMYISGWYCIMTLMLTSSFASF